MPTLENIFKLIRQNLDFAEPDEGHFIRFKEKLNQQEKQNRFRLISFTSIASIILILLMTTFGYYYFAMGNYNEQYINSLGDISPEYLETELYFKNLIRQNNKKIKSLEKIDTSQKIKIINDLSKMERYYKSMIKDLRKNPDNEMIINALINYYQLKIEIQNQILVQLNELEQVKINYYENNKEI